MNDFEYKVSVIVPVYNVEDYVGKCLDSLIDQTIDLKQLQVIIVNDGSTDNSLQICEEYAELYDIFEVYTKENEGASAARNYAIQLAKGKYLMYLDSDDAFTPQTVKNVTDFFDEHYDEVDIVTFPIMKYHENWKKIDQMHFRYKYLNQTGIYDLNKFPYITQTTMNICTKNLFDCNIFHETKMIVHEDQKYNNDILVEKQKIGFCKEAEYQYLQHPGSIMHTFSSPIELWEKTIHYYENLFENLLERFEEIPAYYQGMFIHDVNWKLRDSVLFPYHYDKIEFDKTMKRFADLMNQIDVEVIMNHPNIDKFHKYYMLSFRKQSIVPYVTQDNLQLLYKGQKILSENSIEIIIRRIRLFGNRFRIYGSIKSPFFSFIEKPELFVVINDDEIKNIELTLSGSSWYKTKTKTNDFWAFVFEYDIVQLSKLFFKVKMDGIYFNTRFWFSFQSPFNSAIQLSKYVIGNYSISFNKNTFYISQVFQDDIDVILKENSQKIPQQMMTKRKRYLKKDNHSKVWLYYDNFTVEYDNGYLQFIHDFEQKDGIEKYYIYDKNIEEVKYLFKEEHFNYLVRFGSEKHKILYLKAEKIFTSFIEHFSITPFKSSEEKYFLDLYNAEVIYLQHGVLHASIPWYYTSEMVEADKVVVSTYFEVENMSTKGGYLKKDLIKTGMPRYDRIDKTKSPQNKIIFAPSWRDYLIGTFDDSGARRKTFDQKLLNSNYFKNIFAFISNSRLLSLLEKYDLTLDLKLHPNFYTSYRHLLNFDFDRINIAENKVDLTEYKLFITDFSSFVFDYAYLNRPIIYFVPDYIEFKAGMNRYRKLDLPFEKAFGNLVLDPEDVIDEIERIISRNFVPDPIFSDRMNDFYLPLENCSEKLYQYLIKESSNYDSEYHHSNL